MHFQELLYLLVITSHLTHFLWGKYTFRTRFYLNYCCSFINFKHNKDCEFTMLCASVTVLLLTRRHNPSPCAVPGTYTFAYMDALQNHRITE